jgi:hypothetical protein
MSTVPRFQIDVDIHSLQMDTQPPDPKAAESNNLILPTPVSTRWAQTREGKQRC